MSYLRKRKGQKMGEEEKRPEKEAHAPPLGEASLSEKRKCYSDQGPVTLSPIRAMWQRLLEHRTTWSWPAQKLLDAHCARGGLANSSDGANVQPWANEEEVLSPAASEAMEAPPHIAVTNGLSTGDEARALPYPPTASARDGSADARERKVGARDGAPHSPDAPDCLWPLEPGTALAAHSVDSRSGRPGRPLVG